MKINIEDKYRIWMNKHNSISKQPSTYTKEMMSKSGFFLVILFSFYLLVIVTNGHNLSIHEHEEKKNFTLYDEILDH